MTLAKLGIRQFEIWDGDDVEGGNIGGQIYGWTDVGDGKCFGLYDHIVDVDNALFPKYENEYLTEPRKLDAHIVISAVDNMEGRQILWESFKRSPKAKLFIDGRIGGLWWRVYSILKGDGEEENYEETLKQAARPPLKCAEGPTVDVALMTAATIARLVRNHVNRMAIPYCTVGSQDALSPYMIEEL